MELEMKLLDHWFHPKNVQRHSTNHCKASSALNFEQI